ncbi:hypothetical protein GGX14DRAFT_584902 [Mycena pura]|uniref:Uncharacterized protein n=1 Tax=Mycena pura TaxID=153505 RepID=A0AAD6VTE7_9AGAR|nr:hypothetical protein GGX14DRAFT_584902 [Mycena pura]
MVPDSEALRPASNISLSSHVEAPTTIACPRVATRLFFARTPIQVSASHASPPTLPVMRMGGRRSRPSSTVASCSATFRIKAPLRASCIARKIKFGESTKVEELRRRLVNEWFPSSSATRFTPSTQAFPNSSLAAVTPEPLSTSFTPACAVQTQENLSAASPAVHATLGEQSDPLPGSAHLTPRSPHTAGTAAASSLAGVTAPPLTRANNPFADWDHLNLLQGASGDPLSRLQAENQILNNLLKQVNVSINHLQHEQADLRVGLNTLLRRTEFLSPAIAFDAADYHQQTAQLTTESAARSHTSFPFRGQAAPVTPPRGPSSTEDDYADGVALTISWPSTSAQVNIILPPNSAFYAKGTPTVQRLPIDLFNGQTSVTWTLVFSKIKNTEGLWDIWGPKTVGQYADLEDLWAMWSEGEKIVDEKGVRWKKPPADGRRGNSLPSNGSVFGRYIVRESAPGKGKSPADVINELEAMRMLGSPKWGLSKLGEHLAAIRKADATPATTEPSNEPRLASRPDSASSSLVPVKRRKAFGARTREGKRAKLDQCT